MNCPYHAKSYSKSSKTALNRKAVHKTEKENMHISFVFLKVNYYRLTAELLCQGYFIQISDRKKKKKSLKKFN